MDNTPIIGQKFIADFGEYKYELYFESKKVLKWKPLFGGDQNIRTEKINLIEIRPNLLLVSWQEKDGTTVTHLEDFENNIVHSNITTTDKTFLNLKGTLNLVKQ